MGTGTTVNDEHAQAGPIRAQLERVLRSPDFVRAERACAFLRFIVEETLEGRADHIKAFTVALGVFERDETFDPGTDTIVRVEAGALRRRLERYYLTIGRDDPIVIDVPKGAYVPVFRPRGTPTTEKISEVIESTPISTAVPGRRKQITAIAGASVMAAITLIAILWQVLLPSPM